MLWRHLVQWTAVDFVCVYVWMAGHLPSFTVPIQKAPAGSPAGGRAGVWSHVGTQLLSCAAVTRYTALLCPKEIYCLLIKRIAWFKLGPAVDFLWRAPSLERQGGVLAHKLSHVLDCCGRGQQQHIFESRKWMSMNLHEMKFEFNAAPTNNNSILFVLHQITFTLHSKVETSQW